MSNIHEIQTKPFEGQKPGTSGLRKKVTVFQQPHYTENFIQCCYNALPKNQVVGQTIVVGGDGRYFLKECLDIILEIGAAAGVKKFVVGLDGILSTPSASCIIRDLKAAGGFILTASHNPGGPKNDFGVKYNCANGGPAPESVTSAVYDQTTKITSYKRAVLNNYDVAKVGSYAITDECTLEIVDGVEAYVNLCKKLFDFNKLRPLVQSEKFHMRLDCMNGVTGDFASRIFVKELGATVSSVINCKPLSDFGGVHPDPNLTYAHELVEDMKSDKYDFGAAFDGDGDRNMILGRGAFVNPSDSIAIIAANYKHIPYLCDGLKGVARSMPTSGALDRVAKEQGISLYETPTGWKFFGNLMDAGKISLCGEESFGQGSDHIREKDGIWAVLCWLSIMAGTGKSVKQLIDDHWKYYGRNYFTRYDYEEVSSESANKLMNLLRESAASESLLNKDLSGTGYTVKAMDDFEYTDPVDGSVTSKQGLRILFTDGSRIIFRLSGTGSSGATIRVYIEKYQGDKNAVGVAANEALAELVTVALQTSKLKELTGREKPTVIT